MCKELDQLMQEYNNKSGNNKYVPLTVEEINNIPKDHTVIYACIIVHHYPKNLTPTVSASLLEEPWQLTRYHHNHYSGYDYL